MSRLLATTSILSVCLLVGACAGGAVEAETTSVQLHALDLTPGCFVPPPKSNTDGSGDGQAQMLAATIEMQLINLSMNVQWANLLLTPVREDPTASEWSVNHQGTRIEGQLLAQGSDWGALTLVAIAEHTGWSRHLDVEYDPTRTVLDLGGGQLLEQTDNSLRHGNLTIGCDPLTNWSVVSAPYFPAQCWDANGNRIDALTTSSSGMSAVQPNGSSATLSGGVGSGGGTLCAQAANRVLNR